ncbi:MAG: SDR family oxidoreductase [Anaerolineae bacterium]
MELAGKVAIVTGGAVRLGKALALALAGEGVRIAVHYRASVDEAQQTVAQIGALGSEAIAIQADLRDPLPAAEAIVGETVERWGQVDILVNSAAIFQRSDLAGTTEALYDDHMAINLKAPVFLCQAFAAQLRPEQRAHIVNIADWRAQRPGTQYLPYTLAKAGLVALTQSLALGLAPNVQVNAIAPGLILPPPGEDPAYLERLARNVPAKRVGSPEEISRTLLFLLHSDYVTGEVIRVTGGQHL